MIAVSKRPGWIALVTALVFHLLLLALQTNNHGSPGFLRKWLLDVLVPAEKVVDRGVQSIWGVWDGYFALIGVRSENQQLQAENNELKMRLQQQDEAVREAERLRAFLGIADSGIGKTVVARVIGRDPSRSLQTVTIDKGEAHGVKKDDSVITPDGVVGRVISTATGSAVVQLLTDAQSEVAAMLRESRVQALFKGTGGRNLELDYIEDDEAIAEGDEVITSGLDQIHPKGLPLAVIKSVGQKGELYKLVIAQPRADLSRLENVLVVTQPSQRPPPPPAAAPSKQNERSAPPAAHFRTNG
jgi:rod shape-determining protein MreC